MQNVHLFASEIWMSLILLGILFLYKKDINNITRLLLWSSIGRLITDACSWHFDGYSGILALVFLKIVNFGTYVLNDEILVLFTFFMWFTVRKPGEKSYWVMRLYWIITSVSILLLTINIFTGWIFYFDANNYYQHGTLYFIPYISTVCALIAIFWFLHYYKDRISSNMKILGYFYVGLMTAATLYDYDTYDLSLQSCTSVLASIIAFFIVEIGIRNDLAAAKEELEIATKEAEAANHAKTVFLNNMSHDIRTPMNAILGFTGLMDKSLDDKKKMKDYIQKINNSGEYLLSIINNVLDLARIESGKETLDEVFVALTEANESVVPLIEAEIANKKINFSVTADIQHQYIFADMAKNKQITMNLLSNAIKYTPEGGSVHLDFIERPSDREGYAAFETTVTDTGIGMSEEFQKHIFDDFSREMNSTESKINGTGLGMSIVKNW